jgi:DNA mismatch endonuclease, patch repair protein
VVFVDGCFWHGCPLHGTWPKANAEWWRQKIRRNMVRDAHTDRVLHMAGFHVVRVWAHEDMARVAKRIKATVERRKAPSDGRPGPTDPRPSG